MHDPYQNIDIMSRQGRRLLAKIQRTIILITNYIYTILISTVRGIRQRCKFIAWLVSCCSYCSTINITKTRESIFLSWKSTHSYAGIYPLGQLLAARLCLCLCFRLKMVHLNILNINWLLKIWLGSFSCNLVCITLQCHYSLLIYLWVLVQIKTLKCISIIFLS